MSCRFCFLVGRASLACPENPNLNAPILLAALTGRVIGYGPVLTKSHHGNPGQRNILADQISKDGVRAALAQPNVEIFGSVAVGETLDLDKVPGGLIGNLICNAVETSPGLIRKGRRIHGKRDGYRLAGRDTLADTR